jgi:hypothetical protein
MDKVNYEKRVFHLLDHFNRGVEFDSFSKLPYALRPKKFPLHSAGLHTCQNWQRKPNVLVLLLEFNLSLHLFSPFVNSPTTTVMSKLFSVCCVG